MKLKNLLVFILLLSSFCLYAQEDLMELFDEDEETVEYAYATFKTTRIINSQSIENPANGVLLFLIQHRFGRLNTGLYELFGLDQATIRLGLEYGITDRLAVGVGRSSFQKTYDGFLKYKILRQSSGAKKMPISLTYYAGLDINSLKWSDMGVDENRTNHFSSRMAFTHQLLIARKFSNRFSLQLMPTLVHKNLVPSTEDENDIFSMGVGGRIKFTNRTSLTAEYYYVLPNQVSWEYDNSLSIGFDIETGGHVFQLVFSNSVAMFERGFVNETQGKWANGDVYFGFNISRVFTIKKPASFKE